MNNDKLTNFAKVLIDNNKTKYVISDGFNNLNPGDYVYVTNITFPVKIIEIKTTQCTSPGSFWRVYKKASKYDKNIKNFSYKSKENNNIKLKENNTTQNQNNSKRIIEVTHDLKTFKTIKDKGYKTLEDEITTNKIDKSSNDEILQKEIIKPTINDNFNDTLFNITFNFNKEIDINKTNYLIGPIVLINDSLVEKKNLNIYFYFDDKAFKMDDIEIPYIKEKSRKIINVPKLIIDKSLVPNFKRTKSFFNIRVVTKLGLTLYSKSFPFTIINNLSNNIFEESELSLDNNDSKKIEDTNPIIQNDINIFKSDNSEDVYENNSSNKIEENISESNKLDFDKLLKIEALIEKDFTYIDYHTDAFSKMKSGNWSSTDFSFIKSLKINNMLESTLQNIYISFKFSDNILKMDDISNISIPKNEITSFYVPFIEVDLDELLKINAPLPSSLCIEIYQDEKIIKSKEFKFIIQPINCPSIMIYKDVRQYCKYINTESKLIKNITRNAAKYNNNNPLIAYLNDGPDKYTQIKKEINAIYLQLKEECINYKVAKADIYSDIQRLRLPDTVLKEREGTCIELSLLVCSCLEEIGYLPLLFLVDGHAFVGVFFNNNHEMFFEGIEKKKAKIINMLMDNKPNLLIFESTLLDRNCDLSFEIALQQSKQFLINYEGKEFEVIDINTCHKGIYTPISIENNYLNIDYVNKYKNINKEISPIIQKEVHEISKYVEKKDKFTLWEKKLLDLKKKNPLINIRLSITNSVKLISNISLIDFIQRNNSFKLSSLFSDDITTTALKNIYPNAYDLKIDDFYSGSTNIFFVGTDQTLRKIIKLSNDSIDEKGYETLYLCLGLLSYKVDNKDLKAPFVIIPVTITKDKSLSSYTVKYEYENLTINKSVFEYIKMEKNGLNFDELYGADGREDDYGSIVNAFTRKHNDEVSLNPNEIFITNLTFAHYIMYKDMLDRHDILAKNPIIKSIINSNNEIGEELIKLDNIDDYEKYDEMATPLAYDSTQLNAIYNCSEGKSFILDGPPGTGKSQTIVNMIVNAIYHDKTVLFIAEKKAALDVVYDRLSKLGDPNSSNNLGRFCLELHSTKATPKILFNKLAESKKLCTSKAPEDFDSTIKQLENTRNKLANIIKKIHEKKYIYSLYDCIVNINKYSEYNNDYLILPKDLSKLNKDSLNDINMTLATLSALCDSLKNDYDNNILKLLGIKKINNEYELKELLNDFDYTNNLLKSFLQSYKELLTNLDLQFINDFDYNNILINLLDYCFNKKLFINNITNYFDADKGKVKKLFDNLFDFKIFYKSNINSFNINEVVNSSYDFSLLKKEFASITGFFNKLKFKKDLKIKFKNICRFKIKSKTLLDILNTLVTIQNYKSEINKNNEIFISLTGLNLKNSFDNIELIYEYINNTFAFLTEFKKQKSYKLLDDLIFICEKPSISLKMSFNSVYKNFKLFNDSYNELKKKYKIRNDLIFKAENNITKLGSLLNECSLSENTQEIKTIAKINDLIQDLNKYGFDEITTSMLNNEISYKNLTNSIKFSISKCLIDEYMTDGDLFNYSDTLLELNMENYRKLINDYNQSIVSLVSAKVTKERLNFNNFTVRKDSELGVLNKYIENGGRRIKIRQALNRFGKYIKGYFPCFLMSPTSAAQYLSVDNSDKFDIVIFDEASQIPTHEAISPIARGNSLVIAGDPEQMPPTSFFNKKIDLDDFITSDEEEIIDDSDSLLEECIAINFPRIRLKYHYRSRFEDLINFSNQYFYNGDLYTFPSPFITINPIQFKYIYKNNQFATTSKITQNEIDSVVSTLKEIYSDKNNINKSLGIITFNEDQKDKIEQAVNYELDKNESLRNIIDQLDESKHESLFIKSLENVQGDERDIIILCINYAVVNNKAYINGALIQKNGKKRLNVAISRSREKMIVLSTVKDIDIINYSNNEGIETLKCFLHYAQYHKTMKQNIEQVNNTSLSYYIQKDLEEKGYNVVTNIGNSNFRVDLAILDSNNNCKLGVIIDKDFDDNISSHDKFYVQNNVLYNLKWKIINICSLQYLNNKEETLNKIINALNVEVKTEIKKPNYNIEQEFIEKDKYNCYDYPINIRYQSLYYDNGFNSTNLLNTLKRIIEQEYPINLNIIKKRIVEISNLEKIGPKAKDQIVYILNQYFNKTKDYNDELFYWPIDSNKKIIKYRKNSTLDLIDISKEEIVCCMKQILSIQGLMTKENLFRLTLENLKCSIEVLNEKSRNKLNYAFTYGVNINLIDPSLIEDI